MLIDWLIVEIQDGKIDVVIVVLFVFEFSLKEVVLFEEIFFLVCLKGDEDVFVFNIEDFWEMKLLLLEEGYCFCD